MNPVLVNCNQCPKCGSLYPATTSGRKLADECHGRPSFLVKAWQCSCGVLFPPHEEEKCLVHCKCTQITDDGSVCGNFCGLDGMCKACFFDKRVDERIAKAMKDRT